MAEAGSHLPSGLLNAIGTVESGRPAPGTNAMLPAMLPWPWTIDVAGKGARFDTRAEAIAAVQAAQAAGTLSIDVGCMQINLLQHPRAFATLSEAFEPAANVAYAVSFLQSLHARLPDWPGAIAAYHSMTDTLGGPYAVRVAAYWPLARQYGLTGQYVAQNTGLADAMITRAAIEATIDPGHALTPEFRAERVDAALFQLRRDPVLPLPSRAAAGLPRQSDPDGQLTPAFRAERLAAAAFDHQRDVHVDPQPRPAPGTSFKGRRTRPRLPSALASIDQP